MKINCFTIPGVALAAFLAGCASTPTALSPVGPNPASHVAVAPDTSDGYLQVYSATEKSPGVAGDDAIAFDLHSSYVVNGTDGKSVKFVANHASDMDEWPDQVKLPTGNYNIMAQSSWCGQVSVPVVIQTGKITVVHLDNNWWPASNIGKNQLVYLPDGEAAGWSSSSSKLSD